MVLCDVGLRMKVLILWTLLPAAEVKTISKHEMWRRIPNQQHVLPVGNSYDVRLLETCLQMCTLDFLGERC